MNFKKMLSICKRSKAYFLYDLPDGEQMLSNGSCGYILYGHPEYTPETLRMVADLAEDDSVIMTRMPKADLPLADQCPNEEYAAPLDTCIVAAGAVWQPLIVGAGMTFINKRALQPIEKEEEGYDLYRRGDLVVVKSGLIVQGVIRTMDLSKSEAVCRDLINLGTVAGMAIVPLAARMCRSTLRTCDYGRTNTQLAALHGITTPYAAPPAGTKSKPKTPGVAVVSWSTRQW